jgi:hypothetical protein
MMFLHFTTKHFKIDLITSIGNQNWSSDNTGTRSCLDNKRDLTILNLILISKIGVGGRGVFVIRKIYIKK